jgi:ribosomal-protein-alanine N-acetyltransferase
MPPSIPTSERRLETPRLILRAAEPEDAPGLFEAFSSPEVMKYWSTLPHTDLSTTQTWLSKMTTSAQNGTTDFIIHHIPTNSAIGKIGIWQDSEIGFMIARKYWRQGIVSEALNTVLPYFFDDCGFEKITADVDPRNEGSIGILERFGFVITGTREKTWEVGGVWVDSLDLELKENEWREIHKKN